MFELPFLNGFEYHLRPLSKTIGDAFTIKRND
jgi:hypothetical protein